MIPNDISQKKNKAIIYILLVMVKYIYIFTIKISKHQQQKNEKVK